MIHRYGDVFTNQWQISGSIAWINTKNKSSLTYFIGVNNGYFHTLKTICFWIQNTTNGLRCLEYMVLSLKELWENKCEYSLKTYINNLFFTRMHYIRTNEQTFTNMAKAGYAFDSSEMDTKYLIKLIRCGSSFSNHGWLYHWKPKAVAKAKLLKLRFIDT